MKGHGVDLPDFLTRRILQLLPAVVGHRETQGIPYFCPGGNASKPGCLPCMALGPLANANPNSRDHQSKHRHPSRLHRLGQGNAAPASRNLSVALPPHPPNLLFPPLPPLPPLVPPPLLALIHPHGSPAVTLSSSLPLLTSLVPQGLPRTCTDNRRVAEFFRHYGEVVSASVIISIGNVVKPARNIGAMRCLRLHAICFTLPAPPVCPQASCPEQRKARQWPMAYWMLQSVLSPPEARCSCRNTLQELRAKAALDEGMVKLDLADGNTGGCCFGFWKALYWWTMTGFGSAREVRMPLGTRPMQMPGWAVEVQQENNTGRQGGERIGGGGGKGVSC